MWISSGACDSVIQERNFHVIISYETVIVVFLILVMEYII